MAVFRLSTVLNLNCDWTVQYISIAWHVEPALKLNPTYWTQNWVKNILTKQMVKAM